MIYPIYLRHNHSLVSSESVEKLDVEPDGHFESDGIRGTLYQLYNLSSPKLFLTPFFNGLFTIFKYVAFSRLIPFCLK